MLKLFSFLRWEYKLIFLLFATSMIAAVLEGVGVALIFPVLQGGGNSSGTNYPFPFNHLVQFFVPIPMARRLQIVAVLLLVAIFIKNLFVYISDLLTSKLQLVVIKHFRMQCVNQLMRVGINYFNKQRASDFQIVIDGYTESVTGAIVGLMGTALPQIFTTVVLLVFLFLLSWKLTVASLVLVFFVSLILHQVARNILRAAKMVYEAKVNFNRNLLDIITGMKLVRLFGRENYMVKKFESTVDASNATRFKADQLLKIVAPTFETTGIGLLAAILFVGSFVISFEKGEWLGVLFTFVVILSRMIGPMKTLNHVRATVIEKIPILQEIARLLSPDKKEYVASGTKKIKTLQEGIEVAGVKFRYNTDTSVVLEDLSFTIPRGSKTGIVGPSGSGKSTLIELLLRFYDPQEGKILIDGKDLRELDINTWRSLIGVVTQDVFLFNDTIAANIAFAKPDAKKEAIEYAAKKAHASEFIRELPQGYDTFIGERGILLSGGQKQRIAIARAVLANPEIFIFDEATSALDSESEKYVQEAIETIGQGKTVITIAHRLSTVFDSDKIIVLDRGRIVEQGRHGELFQQNGLYAKLVKMQDLEREIKEPEEKVIVG